MSFDIWITYIIAIFIASLIPGPSTVLAFIHGLNFGLRLTVISAMGNVVASLIQAIISYLATGIILAMSETVFETVRILGGIYIFYLGIRFLSIKLSFGNGHNTGVDHRQKLKMFMDGFNIAILNPKAILFFVSLFPTFAGYNYGNAMQFIYIMLPIASIAFICFMLYALFGVKIKTTINNTTIGNNINRFFAVAFMLLGSYIIIAGILAI